MGYHHRVKKAPNISHNKVATRSTCGGIFNNDFITPEKKNCSWSRIEVRPTALLRYHAGHWLSTLTYDLNFQSQASYGHDHHTQKLKFKGQSVQKTA